MRSEEEVRGALADHKEKSQPANVRAAAKRLGWTKDYTRGFMAAVAWAYGWMLEPGEATGLRFPTCGGSLTLVPYPDTGTSVDVYDGTCREGHTWAVQVERQDESATLRETKPEGPP